VNLPEPEPATKHVPEWYMRSEKYVGSDHLVVANYSHNLGLKNCVPFLDGLTTGYMIILWTDVQVQRDINNEPVFTWASYPDPITIRPEGSGKEIPRPAGHGSTHLAWMLPWGFKTPDGFSVLVSHPFNRFDLPFTTLSGVIDSDTYFANGNVPFFLRSDFQGVISAGTPILQVTPLKRESWQAVRGDESLLEEMGQQKYNAAATTTNLYKKRFWKRKNFS
jgi:hypothetical protein